jgi:hypothetical protein
MITYICIVFYMSGVVFEHDKVLKLHPNESYLFLYSQSNGMFLAVLLYIICILGFRYNTIHKVTEVCFQGSPKYK